LPICAGAAVWRSAAIEVDCIDSQGYCNFIIDIIVAVGSQAYCKRRLPLNFIRDVNFVINEHIIRLIE